MLVCVTCLQSSSAPKVCLEIQDSRVYKYTYIYIYICVYRDVMFEPAKFVKPLFCVSVKHYFDYLAAFQVQEKVHVTHKPRFG